MGGGNGQCGGLRRYVDIFDAICTMSTHTGYIDGDENASINENRIPSTVESITDS